MRTASSLLPHTPITSITSTRSLIKPPPHPADWRWEPLHLVDFADALVGDRCYELIAIHISLFRCDKSLLETFVKAYAQNVGLPVEAVWGPPQTFGYRLMCYTLLHTQDALRMVWEFRPDLRSCTTLTELQNKLWEINYTST
jgi:hypothetical protein